MTQATVREPLRPPCPLCDTFSHYGVSYDPTTNEMRCAGCGQRWLPCPLQSETLANPKS